MPVNQILTYGMTPVPPFITQRDGADKTDDILPHNRLIRSDRSSNGMEAKNEFPV